MEPNDVLSSRFGLAARGKTVSHVKGALTPERSPMAWAPMYGSIHAGNPADEEASEELIQMPAFIVDGYPHGFALRVEGDCMDRALPEGCFVMVDSDREPSNGSVVAVTMDDYQAVLRRYYRGANTLVLAPDSHNPAHRDIVITDEDSTVTLVGTVVWFQSDGEMG